MPKLHNKTALLTGAANGLGRALAVELHRRGCHLALLDIDLPGLETLQDQLAGGDRRVSIHPVDVSDETAVAACREEVLAQHGAVELLINNAGVSISQPFEVLQLADYRWLFEINFWGAVYCTRHFLPELKKGNGSHLANIISDFALMGFPGKTSYGSSKSAVLGFTNALKTELAGSSVCVSLVIPPPLDTGLVARGKHIDADKQARESAFLKKNGMPLDRAARKIVHRISKGQYRIIIGPMMFWADAAARLFPTLLHRVIGAWKERFDFL